MANGKGFAEREKAKREARYKELMRFYDDPALKTVCDDITPDEIRDLNIVQVMWEAFNLSPNGVGLAAPQVGITKRAMLIAPKGVVPTMMYNPTILDFSEEKEKGQEGCLSYPDFYTDVWRSKTIRIRFQTLEVNTDNRTGTAFFKTNEGSYDGYIARVIQHEVDHLNGVCEVGDAWRQTLGK